ncbi:MULTISPECIES: prepilin-type N-terminal cleavage/methylation domain-containing protein [Pseudanabaena]|uniref:prepilin-type N-terminal cleavage/methylation domain-containing protein n=1 Tax=Pseudanabaena TaxID=1152 RepID=UPI00247A6567|nr:MULTISPECIES: prepilin-type N-terminal cleavage/methylation domain-containing protein [Pseudanabaena]MEA5487007.1 prepilin-type N-terminal cleavage/methylation domain-containing protein [Pseudanabaena sp. CCNP1317]WGS71786.1 prepilin-type N-terminal cleavage/methylation domain-containing protein [Pseudanabaena galeata CCNP1313]
MDTRYRKPHDTIAPSFAGYLSYILKTRRSLESEETGFTLLESLVAAAVVGILIVSIAPMVALSTSARVNARRIDQATQAGRSYIDAVRGGVIDVTNFPNNLVISQPNSQNQYSFEDPSALLDPARTVQPPTTASFPPATICNNTLAQNVPSGRVPGICIDANGNGFSIQDPQDFFIQPMRSGPLSSVTTAATDLRSQGFWLAIRVYRADALLGTAPLRTGTEDTCTQGNTPFASTASITCPIVTMRSQIFLPTVNPKNIDDIKRGIGSN